LVVLADAHLGAAPPPIDQALEAFLETVPTLGDCLLINGDLFDFWFAYRHVVPRAGFGIAALLATLRRRIPIVMTGGNHDRWGDSFWERDLKIPFSPEELRFEVAGRRIVARHGDGIAEAHRSARVLHWFTSRPTSIRLYRLIHPDLAFRLIGKMSRRLADDTRDGAVLDRAAERQRNWATSYLRENPAVDLVVLGHTHRPALVEVEPHRYYLNSGAWVDGMRYAVVAHDAIELKIWS
jgi:UDP-2,3-diacylglucosamine hydrolase